MSQCLDELIENLQRLRKDYGNVDVYVVSDPKSKICHDFVLKVREVCLLTSVGIEAVR